MSTSDTLRPQARDTAIQPRIARGVPTGGQFATDARTEPDIRLALGPADGDVDLTRALSSHLGVTAEDVTVTTSPMAPLNLPLLGEVVEQATFTVERDPARWSSAEIIVRRNMAGEVVVGALEVERLHDQRVTEGHAVRVNLLSRHLEAFDDKTVAENIADLDALADVNDRLAASLYLPQLSAEKVASRRTWVYLTGERADGGSLQMNVTRDGQVVCRLQVAEDGTVLSATVSGAGAQIEADEPDGIDAVCEHVVISIDTAAGRDPQGPGAWTRADLEARLRAAFVGDPADAAIRDAGPRTYLEA